MSNKIRSAVNSSKNFPPQTVVCKLSKFIRSTIFNFNKVTSKINIDGLLPDPNYFPCNCSNPPYIQKQPSEVLCTKEKVFLEISQIRRKHLCQSLFFNKDAGRPGGNM